MSVTFMLADQLTSWSSERQLVWLAPPALPAHMDARDASSRDAAVGAGHEREERALSHGCPSARVVCFHTIESTRLFLWHTASGPSTPRILDWTGAGNGPPVMEACRFCLLNAHPR